MVKDYVCVDIETSGVRVKWDKIIEIGAVKVRDSKAVDTFSELINPGLKLSPYITELTGITDEMLKDKPFIEKVLPRFIEFTGDDVIMGHNIMFDYSFLKQNAINQKLKFDKMGIDTFSQISFKYLSLPINHFGSVRQLIALAPALSYSFAI